MSTNRSAQIRKSGASSRRSAHRNSSSSDDDIEIEKIIGRRWKRAKLFKKTSPFEPKFPDSVFRPSPESDNSTEAFLEKLQPKRKPLFKRSSFIPVLPDSLFRKDATPDNLCTSTPFRQAPGTAEPHPLGISPIPLPDQENFAQNGSGPAPIAACSEEPSNKRCSEGGQEPEVHNGNDMSSDDENIRLQCKTRCSLSRSRFQRSTVKEKSAQPTKLHENEFQEKLAEKCSIRRNTGKHNVSESLPLHISQHKANKSVQFPSHGGSEVSSHNQAEIFQQESSAFSPKLQLNVEVNHQEIQEEQSSGFGSHESPVTEVPGKTNKICEEEGRGSANIRKSVVTAVNLNDSIRGHLQRSGEVEENNSLSNLNTSGPGKRRSILPSDLERESVLKECTDEEPRCDSDERLDSKADVNENVEEKSREGDRRGSMRKRSASLRLSVRLSPLRSFTPKLKRNRADQSVKGTLEESVLQPNQCERSPNKSAEDTSGKENKSERMSSLRRLSQRLSDCLNPSSPHNSKSKVKNKRGKSSSSQTKNQKRKQTSIVLPPDEDEVGVLRRSKRVRKQVPLHSSGVVLVDNVRMLNYFNVNPGTYLSSDRRSHARCTGIFKQSSRKSRCKRSRKMPSSESDSVASPDKRFMASEGALHEESGTEEGILGASHISTCATQRDLHQNQMQTLLEVTDETGGQQGASASSGARNQAMSPDEDEDAPRGNRKSSDRLDVVPLPSGKRLSVRFSCSRVISNSGVFDDDQEESVSGRVDSSHREDVENSVSVLKAPKLMTVKGNKDLAIGFAVILDDLGVKTGRLEIKAGGEKHMHCIKKHNICYGVIEGEADLCVGDERYKMEKGCDFVVEKNSEYSIRNTSRRRKLLLHFVKFP